MRITVIALSLLCLLLTGTTIYYARALGEERARSVPAVLPPSAALPPAVASGPARAETSTRDPPAKANLPMENKTRSIRAMTEEEMKASQMQFAESFLAQADDPQARQDLMAERRMQIRHSFPSLDRVLGLSSEEHSRLLDMLAEQQIDIQMQHSRCVVDPACNSQRWHYNEDSQQREIAALLGPDRSQQFESYKNTLGERESVTNLRARLPDSQRLSDANAEGLIAALAEERAALSREAAQNGGGTFGFGMGAGMLFAPSEGTPETQYEAARQYSQRLRDRAAAHLTTEQQRQFNEMQDEQLIAFRNMLRNKNNQLSAVTYSSP
jgi:hypothetical protein